MRRFIIVLFLLIGMGLEANSIKKELINARSWRTREASYVHVNPYSCPEGVSEEAWRAVQPYLLPESSPLRFKLDHIFGTSRATANKNSFLDAGFELTQDQGLHVIVAAHRNLKGYLVKVLLDKNDDHTKRKKEDWKDWVKRIEGEKVIREGIAALGYKKYFKVPRQWIYPLPLGPSCPDGDEYHAKGFILVVEDMKLEPKSVNTKYYRNIGKKSLDAIYEITTKYGLSDCCNKHNLPLCKDGKLAFVDTETFYNWPVDYHRMIEFLSDSGRAYWKILRTQNGPKKK